MVKVPVNARHSPGSVPYPVTPTSPSASSQTSTLRTWELEPPTKTMESQWGSSVTAAARSGHRGDIKGDNKHDLPAALQVGQSSAGAWADDGRTSLGVPPSDLTPRSSSESQRSQDLTYGSPNVSHLQSTNPYLRSKHDNLDNSQQAVAEHQSGTAVWADRSEKVPVNLSSEQHQSTSSHLESSIPATPGVSPKHPPPVEHGVNFTVHQKYEAQSPTVGSQNDHPNNQESAGFRHQVNRTNHDGHTHHIPASSVSYAEELRELVAQPFQNPSERTPQFDAEIQPLPSFPATINPSNPQEEAPDLVAKDRVEGSEITPPRPQHQASETRDPQRNLAQEVESQQAKIKQQRNQTYPIRHVNWFDASSAVNPRRSPIMVQNANGPCPLLALVNALVLSTPANLNTGLVETLRVREQVSLGLLLDAVIDELMSGRRGDAAQALPDVSDLYAFLINLHTGMNVNPRFVEPVAAPTNLLDTPNDEATDGSSGTRRAGGFEDNPFMRLYSTFAISLIHGWLPRKNHPICAALSRSATTYEDAQSLLFAEEDLESKLQSQGLTLEEQRLLEDISSVKHFLTSSPTQLTDYGLDTITEALRPGAIAILFRNDHFSTLYKQPRSGRIFTLVTDMGYAGHDEVVWESLVDISGEGSEFFSGDFRPVGNNVTSHRSSTGPRPATDDASWTTVSRSGGRGMQQSSLPPNSDQARLDQAPITNAFSQLSVADSQNDVTSATTMQEDHDLALAMRLQEEEEDLERQEVAARRRREDELSQAYLDSTSRSNQRNGRPPVPPRGGGAKRAPARKQDGDPDAPPPTYEQAAKGPAYQAPANSSYHTQVPLRTNIDVTGAQASRPVRQTSAYSQTNATHANANRPGPAMRRQQATKKEEKDCVIM
ncbi:MAG: hypothetical protein Q9216_006777 [Gyalolechia sp. 2 TL-2023]